MLSKRLPFIGISTSFSNKLCTVGKRSFALTIPKEESDQYGELADGAVKFWQYVPVAKQDFDIARIEIMPQASTPVQHLSGRRTFIDLPVAGQAYLLCCSPQSQVSLYAFDSSFDVLGVGLEVGQGWTICWIAGTRGVTLLEYCNPPFLDEALPALDGIVEVNTSSPQVELPALFWEEYFSLAA